MRFLKFLAQTWGWIKERMARPDIIHCTWYGRNVSPFYFKETVKTGPWKVATCNKSAMFFYRHAHSEKKEARCWRHIGERMLILGNNGNKYYLFGHAYYFEKIPRDEYIIAETLES